MQAIQLSEIFSNIPAGICVFENDKDMHIQKANDFFYKIFGYSKGEALDCGFDSLAFAMDRKQVEGLLKCGNACREKGEHYYEVELVARHCSGARIELLARCYIDGGEKKLVNANIIDVTARKKMREQLRMREESYKLALAQSGKTFIEFDIANRRVSFPKKFAELFGLPEEAENVPESIVKSGVIEPISKKTYTELYDRIFSGEPMGSAIICCKTAERKAGTIWLNMAFTTVYDDGHKPVSAIITYEDLTKQYEKELAEAWQRQDLVTISEDKYTVAECNLTQDRLLGRKGHLVDIISDKVPSYEEGCREFLEELICEEDFDECRKFFERSRLLGMFEAGVTEDSVEYRVMGTDMTRRWMSTSVRMIADPYSGEILGRFMFRDIHEQKTGEIKLEQSVDELKRELENSRVKLMINQMQPHFLYNALSAIRTIIKVDPDYAYDLIYDFTIHLRSNIKALQSDEAIPFSTELKNIKAYLNIERMRFGDSLRVKYEIDCEDFDVIPLSIQPLAENAARHGVYEKGEEGGTVTIRTFETVDSYVVEVEDDGVGFDVNAVLSGNGDSVALKNLIFRLKSLMNADITIKSVIGEGTKATVKIPKKKKV